MKVRIRYSGKINRNTFNVLYNTHYTDQHRSLHKTDELSTASRVSAVHPHYMNTTGSDADDVTLLSHLSREPDDKNKINKFQFIMFCLPHLPYKKTNITYCIVWVRNLACHIKVRTMMVSDNRALRGIFRRERKQVTEAEGNCIMSSSIVYTIHQI